MIRSRSRGWGTIYKDGAWVYADNGQPASEDRPCRRCGRPPTAEGHDACLGRVPGAASACCGHGVEKPCHVEAT
jgi:hypothetical protein